MSWILLIIIGGIIGWLASLIMGTDRQQGLLWNVIIGIAGALLGKFIFADLLGIGGAALAGTFSWAGILWGVLGAVVLIVILKALNLFK
jgi:uncharacterized membrane protein YeaQ/YmgE (transglycosylase-associated protein family)